MRADCSSPPLDEVDESCPETLERPIPGALHWLGHGWFVVAGDRDAAREWLGCLVANRPGEGCHAGISGNPSLVEEWHNLFCGLSDGIAPALYSGHMDDAA